MFSPPNSWQLDMTELAASETSVRGDINDPFRDDRTPGRHYDLGQTCGLPLLARCRGRRQLVTPKPRDDNAVDFVVDDQSRASGVWCPSGTALSSLMITLHLFFFARRPRCRATPG